MKFLFVTFGLIVAGAVGTGFTSYCLNCNPALHAAAAAGDTMAWLRADFHLTDAQFAAIRDLHAAYAPSCDEHCRLIREATQARDVLAAAGTRDATALAAMEQKLRTLHATCDTALTEQVQQVAALMSPEDGRRYLVLLLPKIASFGHAAAPDLHLNAR
jgi:uncharacterized membrane protein